MKWVTHQSVAVGTVVLLGLPHAMVGGTVLGAIFPDMIDHSISRMTPNPQKTFNAIHRGLSHWFGWYAVCVLFFALSAWYPRSFGGLHVNKDLLLFVGGLGIGGLFHVLLDMCTPSGVPLKPYKFKERFSLKLFSTGSPQEYLFLALILALFAALGFDDVPHALRSFQRMF